MMPERVPFFTKDDLLAPGESEEYRKGDRATTVGWLNELFLYGPPNRKYTTISEQDRKDHESVLATFRRVNGISIKVNLHDWEENPKNSPIKQAKALNKCMKELGYVVFEKR